MAGGHLPLALVDVLALKQLARDQRGPLAARRLCLLCWLACELLCSLVQELIFANDCLQLFFLGVDSSQAGSQGFRLRVGGLVDDRLLILGGRVMVGQPERDGVAPDRVRDLTPR